MFFVVLFERVAIAKLLIRFSTIMRAGGRVCRAGDDNPVGRSPTRVHEAEIAFRRRQARARRFQIDHHRLQGATFANGRVFCGLANNGALQMIQGQLGRQKYWRSNLKRLGFDPIKEITRNLFRFI